MVKRVLVYGMTDNPGGIETYLMYMLQKMKEKDIQFDFVTDFPEIAYKDEIENFGSKVFYIPPKGKKLISHWRALWRILKTNPQYKSVYFNILDAGAAFTILIPWILKRKIIVHSHNGATDKKTLHTICRPFLNLMADNYAACSKLAAKYMFGEKTALRKDILIIPNAIDVAKYDFNPEVRKVYREKLELNDEFVLCHVGRITNQKNPYRLIDIFEEIYKEDKNTILLYVGTGELKNEVVSYAKKKKCAGNIRFLGVRNDIAEIMQASDVFFLPSLYEGLPIVAIEAQASGLPVVLSTAITEEVDISGNVYFVDLESDNDTWAKRIFACRVFERTTTKQKIIDAGYDKNTFSSNMNRFVNIL